MIQGTLGSCVGYEYLERGVVCPLFGKRKFGILIMGRFDLQGGIMSVIG